MSDSTAALVNKWNATVNKALRLAGLRTESHLLLLKLTVSSVPPKAESACLPPDELVPPDLFNGFVQYHSLKTKLQKLIEPSEQLSGIRAYVRSRSIQEFLRKRLTNPDLTPHFGPIHWKEDSDGTITALVPVLFLEKEKLAASLESMGHEEPFPTFLHALVNATLEHCLLSVVSNLHLSDALPHSQTPHELLRRAAGDFCVRHLVRTLELSYLGDSSFYRTFWEDISQVAACLYEGKSTRGQILICNGSEPDVDLVARFVKPIDITSSREVLKVLRSCGVGFLLICDGKRIHGIARDSGLSRERLTVSIQGTNAWALRLGDRQLLGSTNWIPNVPDEDLWEAQLKHALGLALAQLSGKEVARFLGLLLELVRHRRGAWLVVAADPSTIIEHHKSSGTVLEVPCPALEVLAGLASIDGAIVCDRNGHCHAFGMILRGIASPLETRERGARYNSAVRFSEEYQNVASIVVSEDGMVDVLPKPPSPLGTRFYETLVRRFRTSSPATIDNGFTRAVFMYKSCRECFSNAEQEELYRLFREGISGLAANQQEAWERLWGKARPGR